MWSLGYPLGDIFIARTGVGGFLKLRWIKIQLMEGKRPFQGSRKPSMAKWKSGGFRVHRREISFTRILCVSTQILGHGFENVFTLVLCFHLDSKDSSEGWSAKFDRLKPDR